MRPAAPPATDALKLTVYFGERERVGRRLYADALLDTFGAHGLASSILLRGIAGFGIRHHLRTDVSLSMSEDASAMAIAVDDRRCIEAAAADIRALTRHGVITVERARLIDGRLRLDAPASAPYDETKLTIYLARKDRSGRVPSYAAVCDALYRAGVSGASVLLGVDGTRHRTRERARFFGTNAGVPVTVLAVGRGDRIAAALPELRQLIDHPLASVERVRVCKRGGTRLAAPPALPDHDATGRGIWLKLMVYTSEADLHRGEPVHRALVRRLRAANTRGATVLRGVWGFGGTERPHGDRFFQLGRRVPVVTVILDRPSGIARGFAIVDEVTRAHGLVTLETVPAALTYAPDGVHGGLDLATLP